MRRKGIYGWNQGRKGGEEYMDGIKVEREERNIWMESR